MFQLITTEHILIAILFIIVIGVSILNKRIKDNFLSLEKKLKRNKREMATREMELTIAELEVDNKLADTNLEAQAILSKTNLKAQELINKAKLEANEIKEKKIKDLNKELSLLRDEKLKEIELETIKKIEKEERIIEEKIILKQKELMEFEANLSEIIYEKELNQKEKIEAIQAAINKMKSIEAAAISARRRQYHEEHYMEFHSIIIDDEEINQIDRLLKVIETIPGTKIKNAANKLIFDYYYRNPVDDLIKRVCEGKKLKGIYKITDKENGMCYIGQSVDIGSRWLTHCKRGAGVDTATNNKLYAVMKKKKIFNFTFEIIEVTDNLNEQEKYWADYFGAKVFGYTMKA